MTASLPRVLVIIGTRPEGIKLAPLISAFQQRAQEVECRAALTGQHTDLMDQVLNVFQIPIDWDLGIMREGQNLYDVGQGVMDGLRHVVRDFKPQMMLVQGDTASVFFASLVGFFERVQVGHVEAGLRSHDKWRPYPEEIFRRLTSVTADLHFAPTPGSRDNLLREGIPAEQIFLTGNTVVDALLDVVQRNVPVDNPVLKSVIEANRPMVLVTAHRREAFGAPMREAFSAIRELADRHPDVLFFYPVHPNPEVQRAAREILAGHKSIVLTTPIGYFDLVAALKHATLVLTDSGGIQEEAPTFGTPVLVMREVTERPEGVRAGIAQLVGTDYDKIVQLGSALLTGSMRGAMNKVNPYGDGQAAARIADIVVHRLTGAARRTSDWQGVA